MCQYLLVGEERTVLIDTGLAETPRRLSSPTWKRSASASRSSDEVIMQPLCVDHCGGNGALKEMNPSHGSHEAEECVRRAPGG